MVEFRNTYKMSKERLAAAHWLYKKSIESGQREEHHYTENGRNYVLYAEYHPELGAIITNYAGCPVSYNHHVGELCKVCGLDERYLSMK